MTFEYIILAFLKSRNTFSGNVPSVIYYFHIPLFIILLRVDNFKNYLTYDCARRNKLTYIHCKCEEKQNSFSAYKTNFNPFENMSFVASEYTYLLYCLFSNFYPLFKGEEDTRFPKIN